jgi:hypothetical protein
VLRRNQDKVRCTKAVALRFELRYNWVLPYDVTSPLLTSMDSRNQDHYRVSLPK